MKLNELGVEMKTLLKILVNFVKIILIRKANEQVYLIFAESFCSHHEFDFIPFGGRRLVKF